jgi:hypothetical protein
LITFILEALFQLLLFLFSRSPFIFGKIIVSFRATSCRQVIHLALTGITNVHQNFNECLFALNAQFFLIWINGSEKIRLRDKIAQFYLSIWWETIEARDWLSHASLFNFLLIFRTTIALKPAAEQRWEAVCMELANANAAQGLLCVDIQRGNRSH